MTFRAQRPKAQPRTLRSIAEDKGTAPAGRDGSLDVDPVAGVPAQPGAGFGQRYADPADAAVVQNTKRGGAPAPKPYK
jgi:hypothetical protein